MLKVRGKIDDEGTFGGVPSIKKGEKADFLHITRTCKASTNYQNLISRSKFNLTLFFNEIYDQKGEHPAFNLAMIMFCAILDQ